MVVEYFIEGLQVMFKRSFDVVSDMRSNDVIGLFRCYVGKLVFDNGI
jgi:hypothetical protein